MLVPLAKQPLRFCQWWFVPLLTCLCRKQVPSAYPFVHSFTHSFGRWAPFRLRAPQGTAGTGPCGLGPRTVPSMRMADGEQAALRVRLPGRGAALKRPVTEAEGPAGVAALRGAGHTEGELRRAGSSWAGTVPAQREHSVWTAPPAL